MILCTGRPSRRLLLSHNYPNVLHVDYYGGVSATDYASSNRNLAAMVMAVNLQIASQNCHVGGGRIVNSD